MTVGIFGGTFDPIHNGHVMLAESFRSQLHLDEVWFLVTPQNPWKKGIFLSDDSFRYSLVAKALEGHSGFVASDYEFQLAKPSFSYQTLRHLRADYPETEFVLLIGADNWVGFDKWGESEEILSNHRIAVYPREGFDIEEDSLPQNVVLLKTQLFNVSSTEIRDKINRGENVSDIVPAAILEEVKHKYSNRQ